MDFNVMLKKLIQFINILTISNITVKFKTIYVHLNLTSENIIALKIFHFYK